MGRPSPIPRCSTDWKKPDASVRMPHRKNTWTWEKRNHKGPFFRTNHGLFLTYTAQPRVHGEGLYSGRRANQRLDYVGRPSQSQNHVRTEQERVQSIDPAGRCIRITKKTFLLSTRGKWTKELILWLAWHGRYGSHGNAPAFLFPSLSSSLFAPTLPSQLYVASRSVMGPIAPLRMFLWFSCSPTAISYLLALKKGLHECHMVRISLQRIWYHRDHADMGSCHPASYLWDTTSISAIIGICHRVHGWLSWIPAACLLRMDASVQPRSARPIASCSLFLPFWVSGFLVFSTAFKREGPGGFSPTGYRTIAGSLVLRKSCYPSPARYILPIIGSLCLRKEDLLIARMQVHIWWSCPPADLQLFLRANGRGSR